MNNEIGRKITSLTLMTIMLAGGMTFAVPGVMPAAHAANANLFVSAENSQFDNYMSGPQVIEVVIIDNDIDDTDEAKGEPDVTVNGKIMKMVQAVDGNWYGYFADRDQSQIADSNTTVDGTGLDFGTFCSATSGDSVLGFSTSDSVGFAVPVAGQTAGASAGTDGSSTGGAITATCTAAGLVAGPNVNGTEKVAMNVLREAKDPNAGTTTVPRGQIGLNNGDGVWPFIQLYPLNPTGNVVIQYNKGGGTQTTTLTFDSVDQYASAGLDRAVYPQGAQVHITVTDLWLNIDPTDEDSWTFGTNAANATSKGTYYQVFNENGGASGASIDGGVIQLTASELGNMMVEDNAKLFLNADAQKTGQVVLTLADTDDIIIRCPVAQDPTTCVLDETDPNVATQTTKLLAAGSAPITLTEQGPNSGVFGTFDESDNSNVVIADKAKRGTSATIEYNEDSASVVVGNSFATVDIQPDDDEWNSGEEIPIVIVDGDANLNSRADEDMDLFNPDIKLIPSLSTGDPFTIGEGTGVQAAFLSSSGAPITNGATGDRWGADTAAVNATISVDKFSERAILSPSSASATVDSLVIELGTTAKELRNSITDANPASTGFFGLNMLNYDFRSINSTISSIEIGIVFNSTGGDILNSTNAVAADLGFISLANVTDTQGLVNLNNTGTGVSTAADIPKIADRLFNTTALPDAATIGFAYDFTTPFTLDATNDRPIATDLFSFGFIDDGETTAQRIANQIVRIEAEETGDNTSTFEGTLEYTMLNQLNILDDDTYEDLSPIDDEVTFIVIEDLTDEDSPRVNYLDLGADGVSTQVADQEEAPSHSGVVSFDLDTYKVADTVTVTLEDADLNVDEDTIDIYTTVSTSGDVAIDAVGLAGLPTKDSSGNDFSFGPLGRLLDITFDDERWIISSEAPACSSTPAGDNGLSSTGFTLIETSVNSGVLIGDFQIPADYCARTGNNAGSVASTTGTDIEVNYVDFRDASGEIIEVGDSAGIRANTGSISLDRTVYPVPWGETGNFAAELSQNSPNGRAVFPIHATGISGALDATDETLGAGDLQIHVRVNDPDFDVSASGEDTIAQNVAGTSHGPVKISVSRGADIVTLAYAGGDGTGNSTGLIDVGDDNASGTRTLGPITEIAPDAGIFELDFTIKYTDGPASATCPDTLDFEPLDGTSSSGTNPASSRFDGTASAGDFCILQGDIITVEYNDPTDASGDPNTVTDSAAFDLRNGVLQSDKSVYIIGSDMILTIIEPDWDLDNDAAETYDLDVLEWDSDAATTTMGDKSITGVSAGDFDPEPTDFRETGDSTGIFQIVIEIPQSLNNDNLERGEEVILEYTDWGPSGSDYVGQEDEDINLTLFTSNFGATVELDQKVYTWTDKVYVTVVAPDHNFDGDLIDEIGDSTLDPIKISTRGFNLDRYKLVETGTDTGIFTGEVILTGFTHDADGDAGTGDSDTGSDTNPRTGDSTGANANGRGPTDGFLQTDDDDGLTVSFEFSEDETVVGSALIRWNIGEVQWLEASYPASGTGVVRTVDPDMNLDPESVDNFDVDVWSDSDAGGIDLTVTETNEATGIFEGTVFFTMTDESSGHRLRVSEGDTITAEYEDNTLPDPYTTADELDITATSLIGTVVPPLERAPAANARVVDAFGNSLDSVSVDQQVQITADLANGQDKEQAFAYLVQVQDGNGVTVSLAWITGSLSEGQSFSPALSWIPTAPGTYSATAFVWESVDNPTALSPPVTTTITVN